ncbi:uncharacterized protein TNIN_297101 [Trichonephila inaurata madagascariensis]|uniref:Prominin-like protein n=1 Tax=Trichonephila inaurata madagascariensis TaxID=2747483 RepID=A0A8X6YBW8_9ARAC|nr:uncharacterized protein TNIN_297101 [Trichonephila inaurata madagascariensis]
MLSSTRICSVGFIALICLAYIPITSSQGWDMKNLRDVSQKFDQLVRWVFSPIGKLGAKSVELFMSTSTSHTLNETIKSNAKDQFQFISFALTYTFMHELALAIAFAIGLLISGIMLFLPCMIMYFRHRQKRRIQKALKDTYYESSQEGWCFFEMFVICSLVALFGAVVAIYGVIRAHLMLKLPFKFASFALEGALKLKFMLQVSHQNRLNDVSRSAFDVIMLLNNVNEDLGVDYMQKLHKVIRPVVNIATSIQWELVKVIQTLRSQNAFLSEFSNTTLSDINGLLEEFSKSVNAIKKAYDSEEVSTHILIPLLNLPGINSTSDISQTFAEPMKILEDASKINLHEGLQELNENLRVLVMKAQYDPTDIIDKLKHVAFQVQRKLDESTAKYMLFVNEYVKEEDVQEISKAIENAERITIGVAFIVCCILLVIAGFAILSIIIMFFAFLLGIFATVGFKVKREGNRISVRRNFISHHCGRTLLVFCYFSAFWMALYWLSSTFFFFTTALPITGCRAMNDLSILDITIDQSRYRGKPGWYSLITSDKFNMSLKDTVIKCQNDTTFVPTLPDPLVDHSKSEEIKSLLNFTSAIKKFRKGARNITIKGFDSFDKIDSNLSTALDTIDLNPLFGSLEALESSLIERDILDVLEKVRSDDRIGKIDNLVDSSLQVYDALISNVSAALFIRNATEDSLDGAKISLEAVAKHASYLNWTADALYESVINESVQLYSKTLYGTMNKFIDGIFVEMELAALEYRKSMSLCEAIMLFYEKGAVILCSALLHPVAASYFGFLLLSIFLFFAVLLGIKTQRYFSYLPPADDEDSEKKE